MGSSLTRCTAIGLGVVLISSLGPLTRAAPASPTPSGQTSRPAGTRMVAAGPHYRAGAFHRFIFGAGYRQLWQTEIEVEVLDLEAFHGGVRAKKRGGGKQTASLTFENAEGREWKFRSIDKDPSAVLPEELRDTFVDALVQDQVSSAHPLGPLVVDRLAEAASILGASHRLVVLDDHERLGEFRKEFAGRLGFIEEKIRAEPPVTEGYENFHKLLDTVDLWKRLADHPEEKVDGPALLRARLFDLLINDFDRHKDQWQWARQRGTEVWQPVPEDRDQAFVRYSGVVLSLIRPSQPRLVDFGPRYPGIAGLTFQGRFVDRRHLAGLEWAQWEEAIRALQSTVTEAVIDEAVGRLPEAYRLLSGDETTSALKQRLVRLPEAARTFYERLADDVEIHGSDRDDLVTISRTDDSRILVRLTRKGGEPMVSRRFDPRETRSIRLYLHGGDDRVVREAGTEAITFRVVGGRGEDTLDDAGAGGTRFYDEGAKTRVDRGPGTSLDQRPYEHPLDSAANPARDWGSERIFLPTVSAGGDLGIFLGGSIASTTYAFRHHPYERRHVWSAGYATGRKAFRAEYEGDFVRENRSSRFTLQARASEIELIRFYGFGNETKDDAGDEFFEILQRQFSLSPQYRFSAGPMRISIGALAQYTREPERASFAATTRPYGFGGFGRIGPRMDIEAGRIEPGFAAGRGGRLRLGASFFPKVWSVTDAFGEVHGDASGFLRASVALRPTLAVRAGFKNVFGRYPLQEAAFLGGSDTVRGLRPQRYAGDRSVFGSAELRVRFGEVKLLLPTEVGVFGLADAGRVFRGGESSDRFHHGIGAGVWMAVLRPANTLSLAFARSEGHTRLYFRAGFAF